VPDPHVPAVDPGPPGVGEDTDQPGQLARIFADAGRAGVNIEDVRIEHATGQQAGLVQLMVEPQAATVLAAALRERGWAIRQ